MNLLGSWPGINKTCACRRMWSFIFNYKIKIWNFHNIFIIHPLLEIKRKFEDDSILSN